MSPDKINNYTGLETFPQAVDNSAGGLAGGWSHQPPQSLSAFAEGHPAIGSCFVHVVNFPHHEHSVAFDLLIILL